MTQISRAKLQRLKHRVALETGVRTAINALHYGKNAPRAGQLMSVAPSDITMGYHEARDAPLSLSADQSGKVLSGDWDLQRRPFANYQKFQSVRDHFENGTAWEDTPAVTVAIDLLQRNGTYNRFDDLETLRNRYRDLDALWVKTTAQNRLPTEAENPARRWDQILVHIDRDGGFLFGNQGIHRLAICKLANVPQVRVLLGVVHRNAVTSGAFATTIRART